MPVWQWPSCLYPGTMGLMCPDTNARVSSSKSNRDCMRRGCYLIPEKWEHTGSGPCIPTSPQLLRIRLEVETDVHKRAFSESWQSVLLRENIMVGHRDHAEDCPNCSLSGLGWERQSWSLQGTDGHLGWFKGCGPLKFLPVFFIVSWQARYMTIIG